MNSVEVFPLHNKETFLPFTGHVTFPDHVTLGCYPDSAQQVDIYFTFNINQDSVSDFIDLTSCSHLFLSSCQSAHQTVVESTQTKQLFYGDRFLNISLQL